MHRKAPEILCRISGNQKASPPLADLPEGLELVLRRGESWVWIDRSGTRLSRLARTLKEYCDESSAEGGRVNGGRPVRIVSLSFDDMAAVIEEELRNDDSEFTEGGLAQGRSVREFLLADRTPGATAQGALPAIPNKKGPAKSDTAPLPPEAQRVIALCALDAFLDRGLRFLSTGELRRSLLARCIMANADIAILEELFDALDTDSRRTMRNVLATWKNGNLGDGESPQTGTRTTTISIERDLDETLPAFDHALVLDGERILHAGPGCPKPPREDNTEAHREDFAAAIRTLAAEAHAQEGLAPSIFAPFDAENTPLVALERVNVAWGDHRVLENLSWHFHEGEHWRIEGPNGSGKTSLLGLITGENTQAFANDVRIMGRKRGSGETIWDLKREMGQVSWQLHREYRLLGDTRLDEVLASGLYDSIGLYRPMGDSTRMLAQRWLAFAGFAGQESRPFGALDWGSQRVIIILRSLIKLPRILILDEPCQGLDRASREQVLEILGEVLTLGITTALHVTHDPGERIRGIQRVLSLRPGQDPMYHKEFQPDVLG